MDYVSYRDCECGLRIVQRERVRHDCNIINFIKMTSLLVTRSRVLEQDHVTRVVTWPHDLTESRDLHHVTESPDLSHVTPRLPGPSHVTPSHESRDFDSPRVT